MKRVTGFILGLALAFAGAGRIAGDTPPGMVPQPAPFCTGGGPSVPGTVNWQGVPGRTYQMQWSTDLQNWCYLPLTEEGAGAKSYGTMFSSNKAFTRLLCSDETPDLAKGASWAPPLLTVTGPWKVSTIAQNPQTPSSIPVAGVNLTFYRWNAGASAPDTTPIWVASTGADGSYTFDPAPFYPAFGTGDRVQVCISGSPNQRVYLPSDLVGSEVGDPAAPGGGSGSGFPFGTGLPIPDTTPSPNPGAIPVFNVPPDNTPNSSQVPAIRLADVLTQTASMTDHLLYTYTSPYLYNTQKIGRKVWPAAIGMLSSTNYYTSSHPLVNTTGNDNYSSVNDSLANNNNNWLGYSNWLGESFDQDAYRIHMNYSLLDPTYQDADKTYQNTLSVTFKSDDFVRPVKMNVFINPGNIPQPSAYQPGIFSFKNNVTCDMGPQAIPYAWDVVGGTGLSRSRHLVMGPVP